MKRSLFLAILCGSFALPVHSQDESLRNEVQASIDRGLKYLKTKQLPDGSFGSPDQPAITALCVSAVMGNPARDVAGIPVEALKGYDFIVASQKEDGRIFTAGLPSYNTTLSLSALSMATTVEKYRNAAIKARRAVVGSQYDDGEKGKMDTPYDGGIGYGSKPPTDMSNTHLALEALYNARNLFPDDPDAKKREPQLNYAAAIEFVSRCQNLPATNKESWVSGDAKNKGGFIYRPGETKVAPEPGSPEGKALRSYASMSYAGLLSFIYADMDMKDQRVEAVREWLSKNYSVAENPGLGQEGLYYYYHTMAKCLNLAKLDVLEQADGKKVNWRLDLSRQMFNLQKEDGSWANENGRWMEKDSVLVTAYAILALEHVIRGL